MPDGVLRCLGLGGNANNLLLPINQCAELGAEQFGDPKRFVIDDEESERRCPSSNLRRPVRDLLDREPRFSGLLKQALVKGLHQVGSRIARPTELLQTDGRSAEKHHRLDCARLYFKPLVIQVANCREVRCSLLVGECDPCSEYEVE